jgi:hypothetical protein
MAPALTEASTKSAPKMSRENRPVDRDETSGITAKVEESLALGNIMVKPETEACYLHRRRSCDIHLPLPTSYDNRTHQEDANIP